jgi:hypothetical protein
MSEIYAWWGKLDLQKRRLVLGKIGATRSQKNALAERSWEALSGWVRKKLKKLRLDNIDKESWQKMMEET